MYSGLSCLPSPCDRSSCTFSPSDQYRRSLVDSTGPFSLKPVINPDGDIIGYLQPSSDDGSGTRWGGRDEPGPVRSSDRWNAAVDRWNNRDQPGPVRDGDRWNAAVDRWNNRDGDRWNAAVDRWNNRDQPMTAGGRWGVREEPGPVETDSRWSGMVDRWNGRDEPGPVRSGSIPPMQTVPTESEQWRRARAVNPPSEDTATVSCNGSTCQMSTRRAAPPSSACSAQCDMTPGCIGWAYNRVTGQCSMMTQDQMNGGRGDQSSVSSEMAQPATNTGPRFWSVNRADGTRQAPRRNAGDDPMMLRGSRNLAFN